MTHGGVPLWCLRRMAGPNTATRFELPVPSGRLAAHTDPPPRCAEPWVPLAWYPRLFHATAEQRRNWKIAGGGYGIHWPEIDEDISTEGLLRGAPAPRPIQAK